MILTHEKRVLCIDSSSTCVGWLLGNDTGRPTKWGEQRFPYKDGMLRASCAKEFIHDLIVRLAPDIVVTEDLAVMTRNKEVTAMLNYILLSMKVSTIVQECEFQSLNVSEIRKALGFPGHAEKCLIQARMVLKFFCTREEQATVSKLYTKILSEHNAYPVMTAPGKPTKKNPNMELQARKNSITKIGKKALSEYEGQIKSVYGIGPDLGDAAALYAWKVEHGRDD